MRLERLDLTRYGRFTDKSLTLPRPATGGPDLHVIYGPNEAGKSTLFSAWLDLLYGIPLRSRYDFLHAGPVMQIGAHLSHAGGDLHLRRLKRNNGSLLDGHDAPIPEAILQSVLGGLSRDGYAAMFSLDDETLEKGGDSILASHGDLGEMLFAASAGLAQLAPQLDGIRTGLDGFHRSGKRSGWLYDAKKQLTELDRQRRELETSASALRSLSRDVEATEISWREARVREDQLTAQLDCLRKRAASLPIARKLAEAKARLLPIAHLPDPAPNAQDHFAGIHRDQLTLGTRIRDRGLRLQGLRDRLAQLGTDPLVIGCAQAIHQAEVLRPEHDSAIKDLPRRMDEATESGLAIRATLSELGQAGRLAPDTIVPVTIMADLRARLSQRSGIIGSATLAKAETVKAQNQLTAARERLGDPDPADDECALAALMKRLQAQDPAQVHRTAQRDAATARHKLDRALAALAPWAGGADALAKLAFPAGWQIAEWEKGLEAARQHEVDARRELGDLASEIARNAADQSARMQAQTATGVTLADAAARRSQRETFWAAHLADLSAASAARFEQALREDDRISALMAEAMAEARRDALQQRAQDTLAARAAEAQARATSAMAKQSAIQSDIATACARLGLHAAAIADLKPWLDLRRAALDECASLRETETLAMQAQAELAMAANALRIFLGEGEDQDYEPLLARARSRLDALDQRREARRQLQDLAENLRDRQQAEAGADAVLIEWRQAWGRACEGTILSGRPDDDPATGAMLDLLDRLGSEQRMFEALQDRIVKMQANRDRFAAAKSVILQALGADESLPWADMLQRLRRAEDSARDHDGLIQHQAAEDLAEAQDQRDLAVSRADLTELGHALGWSDGETTLPEHLGLCHAAKVLRQDIIALQRDLDDAPFEQSANPQDAILLQQQIDNLIPEQQLLRNETEAQLTAHIGAKRLLEAIGADDALARIASARENLLLETAERARAHLSARFGLIAFETGLRRYRDLHRSAMLARASDAFNRLSRGGYSGLAAQPDGTKEVLVALPAGGGAKLANDLSKGTRFQLYLALRIAGYHELSHSRTTVPFIADDIMETFDDDRSAAAFTLLAEMAHVGQVIYLTHHRHLCDVARSICPEANIIDLTIQ